MIESLPSYPDGDCGIVAIDILLAISCNRDWKCIDFSNLHERRAQLALSHPTSKHGYLGGAISPAHISTPTSSISSVLASSVNLNPHVTGSNNDNSPTCSLSSFPDTHSIQYYESLHLDHSIIGSLDGANTPTRRSPKERTERRGKGRRKIRMNH